MSLKGKAMTNQLAMHKSPSLRLQKKTNNNNILYKQFTQKQIVKLEKKHSLIFRCLIQDCTCCTTQNGIIPSTKSYKFLINILTIKFK